jgi:palmitoyltransferase ZDHHC9/14/18
MYPAPSLHAPSVISERMTDFASEDGEDYYPEGAAAARLRARAAAEGSLRPSSPPQREWNKSPPSSRRGGTPGYGGTAAWRANNSGISGGAFPFNNSSRPISVVSHTSNATHVPAITSTAFFRPMSSQRLQAQRAGTRGSTRPSTSGQAAPEVSLPNRPRANSMGSQHTETNYNTQALPEMSEQGDNQSIASRSNSRFSRHVFSHNRQYSNQANQTYSNQASQGHVPHAPSSFRSSFLLPRKHSREPSLPFRPSQYVYQQEDQASEYPEEQYAVHEKAMAPAPEPLRPKLGKNHEYFTGNTVFCWGGRLQNARDRPINIATGILVILPSALWFAYS